MDRGGHLWQANGVAQPSEGMPSAVAPQAPQTKEAPGTTTTALRGDVGSGGAGSSGGDEVESRAAGEFSAQKGFAQIKQLIKLNAVVKKLEASYREAEGTDAVLFRHVPRWVRFTKIAGFRYRLVQMVRDHGDESRMMLEHVTFFGPCGASGGADRIGSVIIHYMGADWFIFSKNYPFQEQDEARDQVRARAHASSGTPDLL